MAPQSKPIAARSVSAGDDPTYQLILARTLVMAGRLDAADTLLRAMRDLDRPHHDMLTDIRVLMPREQGRFRESVRVSKVYFRAGGDDGAILYEEMDALARIGGYASAQRLFATRIAPPHRTAASHPALAALRHGYESPLDTMGRYVPRSELDFLMSAAFRQAGLSDSAAGYAQRVRDAWRGADAEVRRRLDAL